MNAWAIATYCGAALAEIAGCFAFWAWLREGRSGWWIIPGVAALILFAWLLTLIPTAAAGRAYAAYGGNLYHSVARLDVDRREVSPGCLGHDWSGHLHHRSGGDSSCATLSLSR